MRAGVPSRVLMPWLVGRNIRVGVQSLQRFQNCLAGETRLGLMPASPIAAAAAGLTHRRSKPMQRQAEQCMSRCLVLPQPPSLRCQLTEAMAQARSCTAAEILQPYSVHTSPVLRSPQGPPAAVQPQRPGPPAPQILLGWRPHKLHRSCPRSQQPLPAAIWPQDPSSLALRLETAGLLMPQMLGRSPLRRPQPSPAASKAQPPGSPVLPLNLPKPLSSR